MIQIYSNVLTVAQANFNIPSGRWKELILRYYGDAASGQTVAAADLGTIRLTKRGRQIDQVSASRLQAYNNLVAGVANVASVAAGAFDFCVRVPFYIDRHDWNCLDVMDADGYQIQLSYDSGLAAKLDSGSVEVFAQPSNGIQGYELNIRDYDFSASAGTYVEKVLAENVAHVLLENDSNITRVLVTKDNGESYNASLGSLIDSTQADENVKTFSASIPFLLLRLGRTQQLVDYISDSLNFTFQTSAAGTIQAVLFTLDFTPQERARSQAARQANLQALLDKAAAAGKTRIVEFLQKEITNA